MNFVYIPANTDIVFFEPANKGRDFSYIPRAVLLDTWKNKIGEDLGQIKVAQVWEDEKQDGVWIRATTKGDVFEHEIA